MSDMPVNPADEPKKNNQTIIIAVVVVVLLCCCCAGAIGGWYLWENGDAMLGNAAQVIANFA
ncbi:MAG: hypothetical protein IT310_00260 [Anaerolineales bacterium]|nr:hypothetical protein [Anaerolineales bacterium]